MLNTIYVLIVKRWGAHREKQCDKAPPATCLVVGNKSLHTTPELPPPKRKILAPPIFSKLNKSHISPEFETPPLLVESGVCTVPCTYVGFVFQFGCTLGAFYKALRGGAHLFLNDYLCMHVCMVLTLVYPYQQWDDST